MHTTNSNTTNFVQLSLIWSSENLKNEHRANLVLSQGTLSMNIMFSFIFQSRQCEDFHYERELLETPSLYMTRENLNSVTSYRTHDYFYMVMRVRYRSSSSCLLGIDFNN
jgi:hypothetical protein